MDSRGLCCSQRIRGQRYNFRHLPIAVEDLNLSPKIVAELHRTDDCINEPAVPRVFL
jgi:hypothetical protein